jgi:transposase-like protein
MDQERSLRGSTEEVPDELRARAVRLYRESDPKPVIRRLAEQLGVHPETLRTGSTQTRPTAASGTIVCPLRS